MPNYRDIGYLQGGSTASQIINTIKHTQVYDATHDGADNRLPYMNRSFISFSYGGKNIEDFNLIAVIEGDRLSHQIYGDFTSNVTESNVFDGQIYWSSHFKNNIWDLTLASDGMTEKQLDEFKEWFKPDCLRELVLAEHPNRAAIARVAQVPVYSMIPFEEQSIVKVAGTEYTTSTTIYKGTISLSFVMDDSFWYSISNILMEEDSNHLISAKWVDANGQHVTPTTSKDALKIILEDNVPEINMLNNTSNILLGTGDILAKVDDNSIYGSLIEYALVDVAHIAYIYSSSSSDITVGGTAAPGYFFYGGTAPCSPLIRFTLIPQIANGYIISPCNSYGSTNSNYFNTIIFESQNEYAFKFTTPGIYTGFNQAINIFKNMPSGSTWEDMKVMMRDNVKHYAPRSYAIALIDALRDNTIEIDATKCAKMINRMSTLFMDSSGNLMPITFVIDNRIGQATAQVSYRTSINTTITSEQITTEEQKVGDMVLSKYLYFEDRNSFSEDGYIVPWTAAAPQTSYRIYTDVAGGLTNFNMEYKYLYR